ncbi:MAG: selenide, water dikinase SelD [Chloroflexi bacterium]|nr:selenide, water dikinase SelD [Chloroflexota bacterium]
MRALGHQFPEHEHPELLVGLSKADDAAVYRLNPDQAIVQTLDFFAPTVDDPFQFGQIAAANALNDVYAMGADVLFALNIAAFPDDLPVETIVAVLEGGASKVREAGGAVAGGHTIVDREPKYGLCVTGIAHPEAVLRKASAQPGDAILLTKPLGTGVLLNGMRGGEVPAAHEAIVIAQMSELNKRAAELARESPVHALTDVTGFGLAGHAVEVAMTSGVGVELSLGALPALPGLEAGVAQGLMTGGQANNRDYFSARVATARALTPLEDTLLYDPQTTGGLLIVLPESAAAELGARLQAAGIGNWRVGTVVASPDAESGGVRVTD